MCKLAVTQPVTRVHNVEGLIAAQHMSRQSLCTTVPATHLSHVEVDLVLPSCLGEPARLWARRMVVFMLEAAQARLCRTFSGTARSIPTALPQQPGCHVRPDTFVTPLFVSQEQARKQLLQSSLRIELSSRGKATPNGRRQLPFVPNCVPLDAFFGWNGPFLIRGVQ